jgi:hypothetical protein
MLPNQPITEQLKLRLLLGLSDNYTSTAEMLSEDWGLPTYV